MLHIIKQVEYDKHLVSTILPMEICSSDVEY